MRFRIIFRKYKLTNTFRSNFEFVSIIKDKESMILWENLEGRGMFDEIIKYDIYSKIYSLNTKYNNDHYILKYKLYKNYNDLISDLNIAKVRQLHAINSLYYQEFIDKWYKEWLLEIDQDKSIKYWKTIEKLDLCLNNLLDYLYLLKF